MARKRKRESNASTSARKARKRSSEEQPFHHPVLASYYPKVVSLRDYLLAKLPTKSRGRGDKVKKFALDNGEDLLNAYFVGLKDEPTPEMRQTREQEYQAFTQSQAYSTHRSTAKSQPCSLHEVRQESHFPSRDIKLIALSGR